MIVHIDTSSFTDGDLEFWLGSLLAGCMIKDVPISKKVKEEFRTAAVDLMHYMRERGLEDKVNSTISICNMLDKSGDYMDRLLEGFEDFDFDE